MVFHPPARLWLPVTLVVAAVTSGCSLRALPVDPTLLGGLAATSRILAADGSLLAELHGDQDRTPLPLTAVPPLVVQAVVAVEDRRFYAHSGVDTRGVVRAAARDVRAGRAAEGASTITQQLVKNTLVTPERSVQRKVREAALAVGLEKTLTKDQILERYLDTVYLGRGAYGVAAGLRTWFGIEATPSGPPAVVTPGQAALLAGLIRSPTSADPLAHPEEARARRAAVLVAMVETGVLTRAQASAAEAEELPATAHRSGLRYRLPYVVEDAVQTLLDDPRLAATREDRERLLFRGGLTVRLTVDPRVQAAAEAAVDQVLTDPRDPQAGLAAVVPGDGAIRAMVGGRDYYSPVDPVARVNLARGGSTKRQAGSTYKVFTLIAALQAGVLPDTVLDGSTPVSIPRRHGTPWQVDNYERAAYGQITLRAATEASVNTAYARLVTQLGDGDPDAGAALVAQVATALGVRGSRESAVRRDPSTTLGAQEVDPVELAAAYATLAAGGVYAPPYLVASVTGPDGQVLLQAAPAPVRRLSTQVAALADDVLAGVIRQGTGLRAALPRPMAGKTGTTSDYKDAWFVGFTPDLAAAVWLGQAATPTPMTPAFGFRTVIAGGTLPAEIWRRFAWTALEGQPPTPLPDPSAAIVRVDVDPARDCLADKDTPPDRVRSKAYLAGSEPTALCDAPGDAATSGPGSVEPGDASPGQGTGSPSVGPAPATSSGAVGGTVVVPALLGLPAAQAAATLQAAGLRPQPDVAPSCTVGPCQQVLARDAGRVWRQDVAAGTTTGPGAVVSYAVGPPVGPPSSSAPSGPGSAASPASGPTTAGPASPGPATPDTGADPASRPARSPTPDAVMRSRAGAGRGGA